MKQLKKLLIGIVVLFALIGLAATTRQLIGPSSATTPNALVRWRSADAFSTTNSGILVDDSSNMSGVNTQQVTEVDGNILALTNGIVYLQKASAPTAATIGGTVGSVTNYIVTDKSGILNVYWSDGTTLYGPKQIAP